MRIARNILMVAMAFIVFAPIIGCFFAAAVIAACCETVRRVMRFIISR